MTSGVKKELKEDANGKDGGAKGVGLWALTLYFLRLGSFGLGGTIALAGYMQRDLIPRGWFLRSTKKDSLSCCSITG